MRSLDGITNAMDMCLCRLWDLVLDRDAWRATAHGVTKSQTRLGMHALIFIIFKTLIFKKKSNALWCPGWLLEHKKTLGEKLVKFK